MSDDLVKRLANPEKPTSDESWCQVADTLRWEAINEIIRLRDALTAANGRDEALEEAAICAGTYKRDASFDDSMVGALEHNSNQANISQAIRALKSKWIPTHRHKKRGSTYVIVGEGKLQTSMDLADMEPLVIYRAEDGTLWARPKSEFEDGRFEVLT